MPVATIYVQQPVRFTRYTVIMVSILHLRQQPRMRRPQPIGKRRSFTLAQALVGLGIIVFSADVYALRCGNKLVVEGMHRLEVIKRCGEPADVRIDYRIGTPRHDLGTGRRLYRLSRDGYYVTRGYGPVQQEITRHTLTYNFGPNRLMRVLRFDNDRLVDIEQLGYGYR